MRLLFTLLGLTLVGSLALGQAPDFSIEVSPASLSAVAGMTTAPAKVSIVGEHGFSGSVTVTLSGLPSGVTTNPPSPFTIAANASANVTFTIPANASIASSGLTLQGSSGSLRHSAPLTLNVASTLIGSWVVLQPANSVTGDLLVSGWAFEKNALHSIAVLVDSKVVGRAFYGVARPDVAKGVPGAPTNCGWSLGWIPPKSRMGRTSSRLRLLIPRRTWVACLSPYR